MSVPVEGQLPEATVVRRLRPSPGDRLQVARLLARCTAADLKLRFGNPIQRVENMRWVLPRTDRDVTTLVTVAGVACGTFTCFRSDDGGYELAGIVASPWQRRGHGSRALACTLAQLPPDSPVRGQIDTVNTAAHRLLRRVVGEIDMQYLGEIVTFEFRTAADGDNRTA